ncbi:MAG: hypothetical protein ACTSR3_17675 [Candidatus Helarchaeota archaeon]
MGEQNFLKIYCNGSDGAIITWQDERDGVSNTDVYTQRVTSSGSVLWT